MVGLSVLIELTPKYLWLQDRERNWVPVEITRPKTR
jgi:hypothetical protein